METRKQRENKIKRFFDWLTDKELDEILVRNGFYGEESNEAKTYRQIKEEIEKGEL